MLSTSAWCSMPRAVEALPCGSMSMTRTFRPAAASAAAMLTVVVVLPTPPFWLDTVKMRVFSGLGSSPAEQPLPALVLVRELAGDGAGVVHGVQHVPRCGSDVSRETPAIPVVFATGAG